MKRTPFKDRYVLATDYDSLSTRHARAIEALRGCVEALGEYGSHEMPCLLAQWHAGRPTKDGGYETRYGDKWYQRDDKPLCTCGFEDDLAAARAALAVKE